MSVVPSNTASSNGVLPTFFAAASVKANGQHSTVDLPAEESDSPIFSEVLQQSGTQETGTNTSQNQTAGDESAEQDFVASDQALATAGNVGFSESEQADIPITEVAPLVNQTVTLSGSLEVTQAGILSEPAKELTDTVRSKQLDEQNEVDPAATAVNAATVAIVDRTDGDVIPADLSGVSRSTDSTDNDLESEPAGQHFLQTERPPQDSEESNRSDGNATDEKLAPVDDSAIESNSNLSIGAKQQQFDSLQELRASLENEFGIRPIKNRQAGNRVTVNQSGLQNQTVASNSDVLNQGQQISVPQTAPSVQVHESANDPLPTSSSAITSTGPVDALGQADSTSESNVFVGQADPLLTRSTSAGVATDQDRSANFIGDRQQIPVPHGQKVDGNQPVEFIPQPSQPVVSESSTVGVDGVLPEQIALDAGVDAARISNVSAGLSSSQEANSDVNTDPTSEKVQSDLGRVGSSAGTELQVGRVSADALPSQQKFDSTIRFNSAEALQSDQLPLHGDSGFVSTTAVEPDSREELTTEAIPVIDSDLDLLQQLLPRETSSVFGQLAASDAAGQDSPLSLPRQIAARAMGEAEVLETGDSSRFRMKLDPPELGSVMVEMQKSASGTTITVTAVDPATQQLLQDSLQQLNRSNSDEASVFDHLDFDLSNGDQGDSSDRESRKSQAEKIRIAGGASVDADPDSASQTTTELDFVA